MHGCGVLSSMNSLNKIQIAPGGLRRTHNSDRMHTTSDFCVFPTRGAS